MASLTIFANFHIDSEERLERMKDSFNSFYQAEIVKWVVNIRGPQSRAASFFLKERLGTKIFLFELSSSFGWFHDTRQMLSQITSDFVMFWVEDHLCIGGTRLLNDLVEEMGRFRLDYLPYSFFHAGGSVRSLRAVGCDDGNQLVFCDYSKTKHKARLAYIEENSIVTSPTYIVSACAIFSLKLFKKIVMIDDPFLKRWPNYVPFDFEKAPGDVHWLPFRMGISKTELFASIDDDHGLSGSSLISRGLYKSRVTRESLLEIRGAQLSEIKKMKKSTIKIPIRVKEVINRVVASCRNVVGSFR